MIGNRNIICFTFLLMCLLFISCKKEKKQDITSPAVNSAIIGSIPPLSTDFWLVIQDGEMFWTIDLITNMKYDSGITNVSKIYKAEDTLIVVYTKSSVNFIAIGNVYNPTGFTTIQSSFVPKSASIINGVFVATANDGINYYLGKCNLNAGESQVAYEFLPVGKLYNTFNYLSHSIVCDIGTSFGPKLAFSKDGIQWIERDLLSNISSVITYYNKAGITYGIGDGVFMYTSDSTFNTNSWVDMSPNIYTNNSDSIGFVSNSQRKLVGNKWLYYGYIQTQSNNFLPCVNTSTNNGLSWSTKLLAGVNSLNYFIANTETKTLLTGYGNSTFVSTYVANNSLNFDKHLGDENLIHQRFLKGLFFDR